MTRALPSRQSLALWALTGAMAAVAAIVLSSPSTAAGEARVGLMKSGPDDPLLVHALAQIDRASAQQSGFVAASVLRTTLDRRNPTCHAEIRFDPAISDLKGRWIPNIEQLGICPSVFAQRLDHWRAAPAGEAVAAGLGPAEGIFNCQKRPSEAGQVKFECALRPSPGVSEANRKVAEGSIHAFLVDDEAGDIISLTSHLIRPIGLTGGERMDIFDETTRYAHFDGGARVVRHQDAQEGTLNRMVYRIETTTTFSYPAAGP